MSVSKEQLFKILDVFDSCGVTYWMDGGWGVDVLYGKQTRDHRDVDINFDARYTEKVLKILKDRDYVVETDWLPIRAELKHPEYGIWTYILLNCCRKGQDRQIRKVATGYFHRLSLGALSFREERSTVYP
jgi:lincosamide nucleotidyltransferase A/C/D/E